jgi:glyoxylase-like metal-dependent hydrolase (beta-lactamase superfamily II)
MMTTSIKILSDGIIKFDGGSIFGQVPKVSWEECVTTDRKNRINLGLNCLLIQMGNKNILVDTGVGSKELDHERETFGLMPSRLLKSLKGVGLTARDIDMVVLSDLHFDHCGGCTRLDRSGNLEVTFPKAHYFVQADSWEEACNPSGRYRHVYRPEDFRPIEELGLLELLDGDTELVPGLWVRVADGPARGHQVVQMSHGGERVAFLGDLVPTPYHLNPGYISAFDQFPEHTLERKRELLEQAEHEGWLLVFYHGSSQKAGYLERRNGNSYLRPIEL